jgi:4-amino-4-deoxy-L-arabinose transferase-like glycosyltransferase
VSNASESDFALNETHGAVSRPVFIKGTSESRSRASAGHLNIARRMLASVADPSAQSEPKDRDALGRDALGRALGLVLVVLIAYRLAYHATYLGEVAFAHATFSDGAVYEQAARDILDHPPLGTRAFYLQGAYAYLLALGMSIKPWPSFGLLVQLLLACATWFWFHRSATSLWGRRAGQLSSIALLAYPGLSFYENKYLSAELGIAANILVLLGFVALLRAGVDDERSGARLRACVGLGLASGLAILARPNLMLAIPFTAVAIWIFIPRQSPRWRSFVAVMMFGLGLVLALAPMAARNLAVTGHPDIGPVHGGGTSFFIGNNPGSKGVWNDAGLLSANLSTESEELVAALSIDPSLSERDRARAIGDALYERSLEWIAENPGDFVALELRKLWLTIGDQQMTQDYDWLGERELLPWAHRVGVGFSLLLALGILGAGALVRGRWQPSPSPSPDSPPALVRDRATRRALAWFLLGQIAAPLAANLLYFTSAQHRLPLVVPLALLSGPGLLALVETVRDHSRPWNDRALPLWLLPVALLALVQGPWPRNKVRTPHPVHYYNLSMAQDSIGEPRDALASMNQAIELRPDSAIFRQRRAHLRVRLLDFAGAEQDLAVLDELAAAQSVPEWVLRDASLDRASLQFERARASE